MGYYFDSSLKKSLGDDANDGGISAIGRRHKKERRTTENWVLIVICRPSFHRSLMSVFSSFHRRQVSISLLSLVFLKKKKQSCGVRHSKESDISNKKGDITLAVFPTNHLIIFVLYFFFYLDFAFFAAAGSMCTYKYVLLPLIMFLPSRISLFLYSSLYRLQLFSFIWAAVVVVRYQGGGGGELHFIMWPSVKKERREKKQEGRWLPSR